MDTDVDSCLFPDTLESGYESPLSPFDNETSQGRGFNEETELLKTTEDFEKTLSLGQNKTNVSAQRIQTLDLEGKEEEEFLEYVQYMDNGLCNDIIDVLIICTEIDKDGARELKEFILKHLPFNIEILDCSILHEVETIFKRSVLLFLYVTEEFCNCKESLFKSQLYLIQNLITHGCINVVPVYICSEKKVNLDLTLRHLNSVKYYMPDQDVHNMKRLLKARKREMLERNIKLKEDRKDFFKENKSSLKLFHYMNKEKLNTPAVKPTNQLMHTENELCGKTDITQLNSNILSADNDDTPHKSVTINKEFPDRQKEHLDSTHSTSEKKSYITKVTKIFNININSVDYLSIEGASQPGEESDESEEKEMNKNISNSTFDVQEN